MTPWGWWLCLNLTVWLAIAGFIMGELAVEYDAWKRERKARADA